MEPLVVAVDEVSGVAGARRSVDELAASLRWSGDAHASLALAVTEVATNLVKHGGGGLIAARRITRHESTGMEIIALDCGRGMANVAHSMRDGHSTAGSPGLGLGSIARIATQLEIYSQAGKGTALRFEFWPSAPTPDEPAGPVGIAGAPKRGQQESGDGWAVHSARDTQAVIVVDGLGHGPEAASAARAAVTAMAAQPLIGPAEQMERLHGALRPTRGAAASVAVLRTLAETGTFCGVGNVSGVTRVAGRTRTLVCNNGTLGHQMRRTLAFEFPFPHDALLVMHTDGVSTSWTFDAYPGLESRHPALIAGVLFRDHRRGNDDATVVVVRNRQRRP
jgi:anti-sigma regulatory factor (Ser/Thr protein kinase)